LGHISKVIFYGGFAASAGQQDWPTLWLLCAAIISSVAGTTIGKRVLDKMQDATFFNWTQHIMLSVGAVLIARALYLMPA